MKIVKVVEMIQRQNWQNKIFKEIAMSNWRWKKQPSLKGGASAKVDTPGPREGGAWDSQK